MIDAKNIVFFKDLTQLDYQNNYYDLHNDYDCVKIDFHDTILILTLNKIENDNVIFLKFNNVNITKISFFSEKKTSNLTINILYRGRFEKDGELVDLSQTNQSYFYIEFEEGQEFEFWAEYISVESSYPSEFAILK